MPGVRTDTELVLAVRTGDRDAFGVLFERWFDRVYDVARNIVRTPETAADVAQDTFIAAWERIERLDNPEAFGGWLLRIARNRALDRLEREGRSRPLEHDVVTGLHDRGARDLTGSHRTLEPEEISATYDRDGLVRAAAIALGEREASVLDLHLRHGLTPAEIAEELGVTANNAHQLLFRMRKKLGDAIGAFVLFRRGRPACADLARLLPAGAEFDAATFELVERHRRTCDECTDRRTALVAPEQLFSAAPILVAPLLLRSRVIEHLQAAGVPTPASRASGSIEDPTGGQGPTAGLGERASHPAVTSAPAETPAPAFDPPSSIDDVVPAPAAASVADRSWRRRAMPILGAAAVVILLLAIAVRPRNEATADPVASLGAPAPATSIADTSTPPSSTAVESGVGVPPATIADDLAGAASTDAPAAGVAPTTAAPLAPTPVTPVPPPATTTPPPTTVPPTTVPPTTAPPAPGIIRLFTPVPLPPGPICASGSPLEFDWTVTGTVASATLVIGTTSRTVPNVAGPYQACGASGQVVTLTVTGPGGSDSASTVVP